jgi:hypothetical protein
MVCLYSPTIGKYLWLMGYCLESAPFRGLLGSKVAITVQKRNTVRSFCREGGFTVQGGVKNILRGVGLFTSGA